MICIIYDICYFLYYIKLNTQSNAIYIYDIIVMSIYNIPYNIYGYIYIYNTHDIWNVYIYMYMVYHELIVFS